MLEELTLASVDIRQDFLAALTDILANNKLKKLAILDQNSNSAIIQDFVMEKLKVALGNNTSLEHLDFSGTTFSNLNLLLEGLVKNRSL
jgi:hypothetical protein